jgi:Ca-activated chloride channel family protein
MGSRASRKPSVSRAPGEGPGWPRGSAGAATLIAAVLLLGSVAGQAPQPSVQILWPTDSDYVSGEVVISAAIQPEATPVERMEFFGDDRLVCTVRRRPFLCTWNAGAELHEHSVRVVAYFSGGRSAKDTVRTKDLQVVESVDVGMVQVTVSVLDGTRFVRGLPRSAFRVLEDDVRQPISYFGSQNTSLELVAAVDISDSMTNAIGEVKEVVKRFLSALRPSDRVKLVVFNENFFLPPAQDLAGMLSAVDSLAPWGMTALHDTIIRSFDLLGKRQGRRGMVVFTDGADTASHSTAEAAERRADSSDAVLYMVGLGQAADSPELRKLCERLARKSGGRAFFPRRIEDLAETFNQILEELSNQYFLTYPVPRSDDKWHRIRVEVSDGRFQVRHREGRISQRSSGG